MKRARSKAKPNDRQYWWRTALSLLLIVMSAVVLVCSVATRYARDNVLNTERFVAIVGPLPSDPKVSLALTTFTTKAIFNASHAEDRIRDILPSKLSPLAGPLADVAQKKVADVTRNFIQTDTFNTIWTGGIRLAHKDVMALAESKPGAIDETKVVGSLNLSDLFRAVRRISGVDQTMLTSSDMDKANQLDVNLRNDVEQLRNVVSAVETGARVLPSVFLALILGGVAVSYSRRKAIMASGIMLLIVGVGALIGFKVYSGYLIDGIHTAMYRDAAAVVYEAFYSNLRLRIEGVIWAGVFVLLVAVLSGPYGWAVWLRAKLRLRDLARTRVCRKICEMQSWVARFWHWLAVAGPLVAVVVILALSRVTPATLIIAASIIAAYESLVYILFKQALNTR